MITYRPTEPDDSLADKRNTLKRNSTRSTFLLEGFDSQQLLQQEEQESSDAISLGSSYRHFYQDLPSQVFSSIKHLPSLDQSSTFEADPLYTSPKANRSSRSIDPLRTPPARHSSVKSRRSIERSHSHQSVKTIASGKMIQAGTPSTQCMTLDDSVETKKTNGSWSPKTPELPLMFPSAQLHQLQQAQSPLKHRRKQQASVKLHSSLTPHLTESSVQVSQEASTEKSIVLSDRVNVAIRLRPLLSSEETNKLVSKRRPWSRSHKHHYQVESELAWNVSSSSQSMVQSDAVRQVPGRNLFSFDSIFQQDQSTAAVYQRLAKPIVNAVLTGRHGTVFAYGPTGSGKTHTMQGGAGRCTKHGMIQMAVTDLLQQVTQQQQQQQRSPPLARNGRKFTLEAQFFEIYNEQVRDLLDASRVLQIREQQDGQVAVNAQSRVIQSVDDVQELLQCGNRNRTSAATALNAASSRSHAIFRLTISSHEHATKTTPSNTQQHPQQPPHSAKIRRSVLNLVDLAGSENSAAAGITGTRKKEAGKINQSLLSLSRVIHALSLPERKRPKHIGYRDSKLTRIMQPHLSGNACLAVLCCISPSYNFLEESRSTLKFADSAKRIKVKPVVNEIVDQTSMILTLQQELKTTRENLLELQKRVTCKQEAPTVVEEMPCRNLELSYVTPTEDDDENKFVPFHDWMSETSDPPPMNEVVVRVDYPTSTLRDAEARLEKAHERVKFLSDKLGATENLVGTLFKELHQVQERNIHFDLCNIELNHQLKEARGKETLTQEKQNQLRQNCLLLKHSILLSLALYLTGQGDLFLVTAFFLWLTLVAMKLRDNQHRTDRKHPHDVGRGGLRLLDRRPDGVSSGKTH